MKVVNRIGPVLLIVIALAILTANGGGQTADPGVVLLGTRVPRLLLHDATILEGVARLSSEQVDLSFAFEGILKAKFTDPPASQPRFDLELENRTISEILDALCTRDSRYAWTRDGLTINVYPRAVADDDSYLPNRRLVQLELKGVTDAEQAVFSVVAQLPAPFEQIACAQAGGDTSYASGWNGVFLNLTVRQAFNLVARHLGGRGGWILSGSRDFRTIGFHKGIIHYSSEYGDRIRADGTSRNCSGCPVPRALCEGREPRTHRQRVLCRGTEVVSAASQPAPAKDAWTAPSVLMAQTNIIKASPPADFWLATRSS